MMMGRSHCASGWVVGLAVAPLFGLHTAAEVIPFAATTAGWALAPDLDCGSAKASRLLGPITGVISLVLRQCSALLYKLTKGPRDERVSGKHRHASHTLIFAVLLGALAWWGTNAGGPWTVAAVAVLGLLLAVDGLGEGAVGDFALLAVLGAGVIWWTTAGTLGVLVGLQGWIGYAVALGCFVHCLGDSATIAGCPWAFPLPIAGETWFELRILGPLSFRTGGLFERLAVFPAFVVAGVLLVPGAWPVAADGIGHVWAIYSAR